MCPTDTGLTLEEVTLTGREIIFVKAVLCPPPASWPCPWPRKSRQEECVPENQSGRISQSLGAENLHCNKGALRGG